MAFTLCRAIAAPLLFFNFSLYIIVATIAGWALNETINHGGNWRALSSNPATPYFVGFALVASVVGIASKLSGAHHLKAWKEHSLTRSIASAYIAWLLTLLAMGLACKEIHGGHIRFKRLKVLEAAVITLAGTQLLYLLSIGTSVFSRDNVSQLPHHSTVA